MQAPDPCPNGVGRLSGQGGLEKWRPGRGAPSARWNTEESELRVVMQALLPVLPAKQKGRSAPPDRKPIGIENIPQREAR